MQNISNILRVVSAELTLRGESLRAFRARVKIPLATWNSWRQGSISPRLAELQAVCDDLGLSLIELTTGGTDTALAEGLVRVAAHLTAAEQTALLKAAEGLAKLEEDRTCES